MLQSCHAFLRELAAPSLFAIHPNINRNATQNDCQKETLLQDAEALNLSSINLGLADNGDRCNGGSSSRRSGFGLAHPGLEFGISVLICICTREQTDESASPIDNEKRQRG